MVAFVQGAQGPNADPASKVHPVTSATLTFVTLAEGVGGWDCIHGFWGFDFAQIDLSQQHVVKSGFGNTCSYPVVHHVQYGPASRYTQLTGLEASAFHISSLLSQI